MMFTRKSASMAFVLTLVLMIGSTMGGQQGSRNLAMEGREAFMAMLGGDSSRYPEALGMLEEASRQDPSDIDNLYILARAYFYDANTHNNQEALASAERTVARILEIEPEHPEALAWHGSMLTGLSRGQDMGMFMKGIGEMASADAIDPENINNRIVKAFTAMNFPPQALAAMGDYEPIGDLEFVRDAFEGLTFYYAPQAQVVITALVGDAYILRHQDRSTARAQFEKALSYPQPTDPKARAGRAVLDKLIRERMDGETPLFGGLMTTCHSCHLIEPDKISQ